MMSSTRALCAAAVAMVGLLGADRAAALTALTDFSGGAEYPAYYSGTSGDVVGWSFSISAPITVTALGVWSPGELLDPQMVGLWSEGVAVASQEVDAVAATLVDGFHYEAIAPLTLEAGTYVIGALYTAEVGVYVSGAATATFNPAVTWLSALYPSAASLGFVAPTSVSGSFGRFGPNFQFSLGATPVPVPGAAALLAGGLAAFGALGAARRRRG